MSHSSSRQMIVRWALPGIGLFGRYNITIQFVGIIYIVVGIEKP